MDAQYKMNTKTAHLITKESSQEEANEMFATMSGLKERLTKVGKYVNARGQHCLARAYTSSGQHTHGQSLYLLRDHPFVVYCDS